VFLPCVAFLRASSLARITYYGIVNLGGAQSFWFVKVLVLGRVKPLSLSARPRRTVNARVGDSSIVASGVLLGKDSGVHRGGRESVGLGEKI